MKSYLEILPGAVRARAKLLLVFYCYHFDYHTAQHDVVFWGSFSPGCRTKQAIKVNSLLCIHFIFVFFFFFVVVFCLFPCGFFCLFSCCKLDQTLPSSHSEVDKQQFHNQSSFLAFFLHWLFLWFPLIILLIIHSWMYRQNHKSVDEQMVPFE